jgi:hypothetical protein
VTPAADPPVPCDQCGEPITDYTDGWALSNPRDPGRTYYVHDGCLPEFEAAHVRSLASRVRAALTAPFRRRI